MWELVGSLLGGGLSLWGELERKIAEEKYLEQQRKALEEAKIDSSEKALMESNINRYYNTVGITSANSSAYGLNGILNEETVRALNSSKLLGQRASSLSQLDAKIVDWNNQIDLRIASQSIASPVNMGDIAMGGLRGYEIGEGLRELFSK